MRKFNQAILIIALFFAIIGCEKKVETPVELVCDVTSTNVTVNRGNDGTITVNVIKGNGGYIFTINNVSDADGKFENLSAGTYTIKVMDDENQEFVKNVTITEPAIVPEIS